MLDSSMFTLLRKYILSLIRREISGIGTALGTITASGGVLLDGYTQEITDLFYLENTYNLIINQGKLKGTIGDGLQSLLPCPMTGLPVKISGTLEFPFEPYVTVKEVREKYNSYFKNGDRVLCLWANKGNDLVVLGKVIKK